MRILILGAGGTLGQDVVKAFAAHELITPTAQEADLTSPDTIADTLDDHPCDVVVNCAAYADVDGCERNPNKARAVNARGVQRTAVLCAMREIHFVHVSTDYVFDGTKGSPYDENDEPHPVQVYGESKLAGEEGALDAGGRVLVVRTSMLMGAAGNNFANKVLEKARAGEEIRAVTDWIGSPTSTIDLAEALLKLVERKATGLVHVVNPGDCSRFDQAEMILEAAGIDAQLTPISASDLTLAAKRPHATPLTSIHLDFELPSREEAVAKFVAACGT